MSVNLIKSMKESIAAAGASKRDIVYFKPDESIRVRFLTELDAGVTVTMHNQFSPDGNGIFAICEDPEEHESCKYCKQEVPLQEWYAWCVWDYDAAEVRLIFQTMVLFLIVTIRSKRLARVRAEVLLSLRLTRALSRIRKQNRILTIRSET